MKWNVLSENPKDIVETLSKTRGIDFNPKPPEFKLNIIKAKKIIAKAIEKEEKIVVYGDYDVDGICATAIVWEALNKMGAKVLPFIPKREDEGYGLSKAGIDHVDAQLIITVDSGIVAHEAIDYAHSKGIKVIVIDHHEKPKKLPKADAIIHTTELCSAGIAYFAISSLCHPGARRAIGSSIEKDAIVPPAAGLQHDNGEGLDLAALATVCDMVPLVGVNRSIVKFGLEELNKTQRPGLKALFEVAGIKTVGTYELGFLIGPRINASGRIDSALTALRLLCTNNYNKAHEWAQQLNSINRERQIMMENSVQHALVNTKVTEKIIIAEHESYHQGIIGLIAGKLTEKYYLPSIVISKGEEISKASARSISGFNIIEAIRESEGLLINAGGHPMAAGFTIKTTEIANFKLQIEKFANEKIGDDLLEKTLKIDCKIKLENINLDLFNELKKLEPYGLGNPTPIFCSDVEVLSVRTMGAIGQHLRIVIASEAKQSFDAVAFNASHWASKLKAGDHISVAYTLDLNTYNDKTTLQLKIKDIKLEQ